MKFIEFLDSATLHETFVFLAQNQGLSGLELQNRKINKISLISQNNRNSIISRRVPEISAKYAKITFWRILVGPWPPHAENLVIPIGILRFSSSPGGLETLQNTKNGEISLKMWKFCKNYEISGNFMKFHEMS